MSSFPAPNQVALAESAIELLTDLLDDVLKIEVGDHSDVIAAHKLDAIHGIDGMLMGAYSVIGRATIRSNNGSQE